MGLATQIRSLVANYISGKGVEFSEDGDTINPNSKRMKSINSINAVDDGLDYIACTHFLEHHDDPERHLSLWFSKLRKGGRLLVILPDKNLYPGPGDPGNPDHRWVANADDIIRMLRNTGELFHVVHKSIDDKSLSFYVVFEKISGKRDVQREHRYLYDVDYSIVIPYKDKREMTMDCLRSIEDSDWKPSEIILVNDGSEEPLTTEELHQFDLNVVQVDNESNLGFPCSINKGVAATSTNVVVLLNNDTVAIDGGMEKLFAPLFDPRIVLTGQQGGKLNSEFKYVGDGEDYVEFYCAAFRKFIWDELGGLDEKFGLGYGEDSDFCIRLRRAGYRLHVVGGGVCEHLRNQTFKPSIKTRQLIENNRKRLVSKYRKGKVLFCVASVYKSGGIKVIWNCAKGLRDAGYETDVLLNAHEQEWPARLPEWMEFDGLYTHQTIPQTGNDYDYVVGTFHNTWVPASKIPAKKCHIGLVQSDEPSWYSRNGGKEFEDARRSFSLPGFRSIIIADHLWSLKDKYGMDVIGKIDNGVDSRIFIPTQTFQRNWPHSIMAIRKGNHVWFDGQDDVDAAAEILARRYQDFSYLIVGHRDNQARWSAPSCSYSWVHTYDENVMCSYFNSVGAYVIPSLIEGSSLTALEAMASGTPLVCTEIVTDAAIDGENALVVPYSNPKAIADAVSNVFDDPVVRERLYHNGLKTAYTRTLERQREQFVEILDNL